MGMKSGLEILKRDYMVFLTVVLEIMLSLFVFMMGVSVIAVIIRYFFDKYQTLVHDVELIAHSCGVPEPWGLRRYHARQVMENGLSIPLDKLHPYPDHRKA